MRIDQVERTLHRLPALIAVEKRQMDFGVVVSREPDVADFAPLLGLDEGFQRPARAGAGWPLGNIADPARLDETGLLGRRACGGSRSSKGLLRPATVRRAGAGCCDDGAARARRWLRLAVAAGCSLRPEPPFDLDPAWRLVSS